MRCGMCGHKKLTYKNQKGKAFPYKEHKGVVLAVDFFLRECEKCGNDIVNIFEINQLDEAIVESLKIWSEYEQI